MAPRSKTRKAKPAARAKKTVTAKPRTAAKKKRKAVAGLGNPRARTAVKVGAVQYASLKEACEVNHVLPETYHYRRRHGWTMEQALGVKPAPSARHPKGKPRKPHTTMPARKIVVAGYKFPSLRAACRARSLPVARVSARLRTGWTMAQALDFKPHPVSRANLKARPRGRSR